MVQQSVITFALLHEFVYEFRGNNTYIILDRTALIVCATVDSQCLVYLGYITLPFDPNNLLTDTFAGKK